MKHLAAVIAALGLTALTCGGSNNPSLRPIALADFPAEATEAECAALVRCHLMSDVDICRAFYANEFASPTFQSLASVIASAHAGKVTYDPIMADACLDTIRRADCSQATPNILSQCAGAFKGTLADGERCVADAACSGPTSFCADAGGDPATTLCNGVCTASPGSDCRNDTQCAANQVCTTNTQTGIAKCDDVVAPGGLDQPCGSHLTCQHGLHCEPILSSAGTLDYTCKAPGLLGDTCSGVPGACDTNLACVPSDDLTHSTCMMPGAVGQSCDAFYQCGGVLLSSLACDPATHACVALPSSGPCVGGRAEGCNLRDSYCDTAQTPPTCVPILGVGEPCTVALSCGLFTGASCDGTVGATCTIPTATFCTP
ncbi:MAG TPA: hypothetical protein VN903_00100 [Polyangia bacterium]|jgi:hypothetical protein|nr:hypothetical protein [Polyangia bacterium]